MDGRPEPPLFTQQELGALRAALEAEAERDVQLALGLAVLLSLDRTGAEAARALRATAAELRRAKERLRAIAPRIDRPPVD